MPLGTVTKIMEDGRNVLLEVTIGGEIYVANTSKTLFDAQITAIDKQNFIIGILTNARRTRRGFENTSTTLIGVVLNIPD